MEFDPAGTLPLDSRPAVQRRRRRNSFERDRFVGQRCQKSGRPWMDQSDGRQS